MTTSASDSSISPSPPPSPSTPSSADLGMLVVCVIWGLNFSITKSAFTHFPPLAFTAVRFAIASALLVPLVRRIEGDEPLPPGALRRLVILGIIGNTLYQLGFITGLARTSASNSALIIAAMPSIVALLAAGLGLEPVRPRVIGGVLVATFGVILVILARGTGFEEGALIGDLLTLAAVGCWACYTLGLRKAAVGITPLRVTMVTTVAGAPGLLLAGAPDMLRMNWGEVDLLGWGALAYATLLSLLLSYVIWNRSVQLVGPSRTVIYMCITPLVAVMGAAVILGERPHPLQGVGAILILAGILLVRGRPRASDAASP